MGVRIAVITPYGTEPPEQLRQCHESVLAQAGGTRFEASHFLVADGHARPEVDGWNVRHVRLPDALRDHGNTPRSIGSLLADSEGFDFIAYLDAGNWYLPGHLENLLDAFEETGSPVCCSLSALHRIDGSLLPLEEKPPTPDSHARSNCLLMHRRGFSVCPTWHRLPRPLGPMGERVFYRALQNAGLAVSLSLRRTVAIRTRLAKHYTLAGETPPPGAVTHDGLAESLKYLYSAIGVTESVEALGFWPGTDSDNSPGARSGQ